MEETPQTVQDPSCCHLLARATITNCSPETIYFAKSVTSMLVMRKWRAGRWTGELGIRQLLSYCLSVS
ncbi:hypothetical protein J6590_023337 [Homalodisca vitripennis]|nr:hypothetical protein J6590_023337 [Homalodisca vitripennis]